MQIAILTGSNASPAALAALASKINEAGVSYITMERCPGPVPVLPCIAALDAASTARQTWFGGSISAAEIATAAGTNPSPAAKPFKVFTRSEFAKAISGVIGASNFATCWGNTTFQIYMSLVDTFGRDDAETTAVLAAAVTSGGMSAGQRTGILNQWPTI